MMASKIDEPGRAARSLLAALAVVGAMLAGCANQPARDAEATQPRTDIVTASDEPEVRRRARVRLELAVGYF